MSFPCPLPELKHFETETFVSSSLHENEYPTTSASLISRTQGWVANAQRIVEVYDTESGFLLKVEDCGEYFIAPHGETVGWSGWQPDRDLRKIDREIILGPVIVLALALRNIWSLHASAVMYNGNVVVFLGESGQGKSTLTTYLAQNAGWQLVADDILPVKIDENGVSVLPHFPQLKLPINAQPGVGLPESLPLKYICVLTHAEPSQMPELQTLSTAQTVQSLLGHIAGTRMFNAELLTKHLKFSTQAGKQIPAYRLIHPHRRDTLPLIREFLEKLC